MSIERDKILNKLKIRNVTYPIVIGLGVVTYIMAKSYDENTFSFFKWTWLTIFWIFVAFLMMAVRDIAYMYRIRILSDKQLSWKQCFDVIMLWEFSSALLPPAIGGVAPAIYFMYKEGVNTGKSTAIALISILLDEIFFIVMVPILYLSIEHKDIFPEGNNMFYFLSSGYIISFVYTLILAYAIFINPYSIKTLFSWIQSAMNNYRLQKSR